MRYSLLTLFLLVCLIYSPLEAQVPGYLGKRWFFEAELGVNFSSLISGKDNNASSPFRLAQPFPRVSVNWVSGRHNFLSLQADYRFLFKDAETLVSFPGQPSLRYLIETKTIHLAYYKINRDAGSRTLAPIGRFFGYKLIYGQTFARPVRNLTSGERFTGVERAAYKLVEGFIQEEFMAVAVSMGGRRVLDDKHTISINFDLGLQSLVFSEPLLLSTRRSETATFPTGTKPYNRIFAHLTVGYGWLK